MPQQNELDVFMESLAALESGGNPNAVNERTGAQGLFQIMPNNWEPWSREALGRVAPRTPENQKRVARHKLSEYNQQFGGDWGLTAAAWFAGPNRAQRIMQGDTAPLSFSDGNLTVREYMDRVTSSMGQHQGVLRQTGGAEYGGVELPEAQNVGSDLSPGESPITSAWREALQSVSDGLAGRQRPGQATRRAERLQDVEPEEPMGDVGIAEALNDLRRRFGRPPPQYDLTDISADQVEMQLSGARRPQHSEASTVGQSIVEYSQNYLGVPYKWGGTDPATGLDCSGFTQLVYKQHGIDIPRVSYNQAAEGRAVPNLNQAQPGDLIAFSARGQNVGHVAIYMGDGQMIHAPRSGRNVEIEGVSSYWQDRITTIRRFTPDGVDPTTGNVHSMAALEESALQPERLPGPSMQNQATTAREAVSQPTPSPSPRPAGRPAGSPGEVTPM